MKNADEDDQKRKQADGVDPGYSFAGMNNE
jgi:hypothetical protein